MLLDFTKVESPGARTLCIIIEVNFIKIKVNFTMVGIIYSYIEWDMWYGYFEWDMEEVEMAFLFSSGFLFMSYKEEKEWVFYTLIL